MNYRTERTSEGGCVTEWVAQRTECTRAVHVTRKLGNAHWPGSLLGMVRVWSSSQKVTLRLNIEYSMAISYHNINCYIPVANVYIPVANVYILFSSAASRSCSSMSLAAEIACGRVSQSRAAQAANHIAPRFPRIIQPINASDQLVGPNRVPAWSSWWEGLSPNILNLCSGKVSTTTVSVSYSSRGEDARDVVGECRQLRFSLVVDDKDPKLCALGFPFRFGQQSKFLFHIALQFRDCVTVRPCVCESSCMCVTVWLTGESCVNHPPRPGIQNPKHVRELHTHARMNE